MECPSASVSPPLLHSIKIQGKCVCVSGKFAKFGKDTQRNGGTFVKLC